MIQRTVSGVEIDVRVVPRAGRSGVGGERDGRLIVRLAAAPVDGAANDALIDLLAHLCDRPKRDVHILSGEKSRSKRVAIAGLTRSDALRFLGL